jgi:hypothetical protein
MEPEGEIRVAGGGGVLHADIIAYGFDGSPPPGTSFATTLSDMSTSENRGCTSLDDCFGYWQAPDPPFGDSVT